MSQIFKINLIVDNNIAEIFIFAGDIIVDISDELGPDGKHLIFTQAEKDFITLNAINVHIVKEYIHGDDSVKRIKEKCFKKLPYEASISEMYLFSV